jgi:foldase protein PrsA
MDSKKVAVYAVTALAGMAIGAGITYGVTNNDSNKVVASLKGGQITVSDLWKEAEGNTSLTSSQLVQQEVLERVLEKAYGDKVTSKQVDASVKETKDQIVAYGTTWEAALQQYGYTEDSYKKTVRLNLLQEYAIEKVVKDKHYTTKELKDAFASYHPEVSAHIIQLSDEDEAKKELEALKKSKQVVKDFESYAKSKSENTATKADGGAVKFDSTSTEIPADVQTAAWKLKNGALSDVITVTDATYGTSSYYIVYMDKTSDKGDDYTKYDKQLKEVIMEEKKADTSFTNSVIADLLTKYNVKISDSAYSTVLSQYTESSSTSSK